ncbi:MAG: transglutaminase domain-containing protein [Deltaproteobacteria bacterium]|nr:transglutaminase domain-containing protein [Deltaproteobacteria bacterium]
MNRGERSEPASMNRGERSEPASMNRGERSEPASMNRSVPRAATLEVSSSDYVERDRLSRVPFDLPSALDVALPEARFDGHWQKGRILDRASAFAREVTSIVEGPDQPRLQRLRGHLSPQLFEATSPVELLGVASHFRPESLQAHVFDRSGTRHAFVESSSGTWVERPDLAAKLEKGEIPSAEPGLLRDRGSATFAIARVDSNGKLSMSLPDVSKFDHAPRAHPFSVGDSVQISLATGLPETRVERERFVPEHVVNFGKIIAYDGLGHWSVALTRPDGSVKQDRGRDVILELSDAELRAANNPNILRDGDLIYDARFDADDPNQQAMINSWRQSDAYRELERNRPLSPSMGALAAFEESAVSAADAWLNERIRYPSASPETVKVMRARIVEIDRSLVAASSPDATTLRAERQALVSTLARSEADPILLAELDRELKSGISTEAARELRSEVQSRIDADLRFHDIVRQHGSIGDYFVNGTGECRHQAIALQVLLQDIGVDSRMTRGVANDDSKLFRGDHMWLEITLSDGRQLIADPTWTPRAPIDDLRKTYEESPRRVETPASTERDYAPSVVDVRARELGLIRSV